MTIGKIKPGENAIAVTKSDTVAILSPGAQTVETRALFIGSAGDVSVEMAGDRMADKTVIFVGVLSGTILPISVTRVNSTGTTANSIVAIW